MPDSLASFDKLGLEIQDRSYSFKSSLPIGELGQSLLARYSRLKEIGGRDRPDFEFIDGLSKGMTVELKTENYVSNCIFWEQYSTYKVQDDMLSDARVLENPSLGAPWKARKVYKADYYVNFTPADAIFRFFNLETITDALDVLFIEYEHNSRLIANKEYNKDGSIKRLRWGKGYKIPKARTQEYQMYAANLKRPYWRDALRLNKIEITPVYALYVGEEGREYKFHIKQTGTDSTWREFVWER